MRPMFSVPASDSGLERASLEELDPHMGEPHDKASMSGLVDGLGSIFDGVERAPAAVRARIISLGMEQLGVDVGLIARRDGDRARIVSLDAPPSVALTLGLELSVEELLTESAPDRARRTDGLSESHGVADWIARPIFGSAGIWGVIGFGRRAAGRDPLGARDRSILQLLADICRTALVNVAEARVEMERLIDRLAFAHDRLERAIEGTSDGLWDWPDPTSPDQWWSPQYFRLLGYAPGEIPATRGTFERLLHPEDGKILEEAFVDGDSCDIEYRLQTKYEGYRWFRSRAMVYRDGEGRATRMSGSIQDVDDRVEAVRTLARVNVELDARNRELDQFVRTASHDLKSPLITIQGYTSQLLRELGDGRFEDLDSHGQCIIRAVQRMQRNIDDLLQLSRIGRTEAASERIDLPALVGEIAEDLERPIVDRGVQLRTSFDVPVLFADRIRMRQVLQNLIENAVVYGATNEHPAIEVGSIDCGPGAVQLYVRDNGEGVDPAHHARIFGLFERLSRRDGGSGIGLSIVQRVAETYGGSAWIESTTGEGATFRVSLAGVVGPVEQTHGAAACA